VPRVSVSMAGQSSSVARECDCLAHRFGNAADNGSRRRCYPSDMTDAEWVAVQPLLPVAGWMRGRGGQPEVYCHRAMLDAVRYLVDIVTIGIPLPIPSAPTPVTNVDVNPIALVQ
jgi:hypothetical protein